MNDDRQRFDLVSRRTMMKGGAAGTAMIPVMARAQGGAADSQAAREVVLQRMQVSFEVNGQQRDLTIDTRATLLDVLRNELELTGSKKGCDHGQCGACTVHVDGERKLACLTLAAQMAGRKVVTIEGLGSEGDLHPMQQAFIDNDAFQCGYCTPGQIMSAVACVDEGHAGSDAEIREYMSGNLCRCAAYPNIVAAVNQAKTEMEG